MRSNPKTFNIMAVLVEKGGFKFMAVISNQEIAFTSEAIVLENGITILNIYICRDTSYIADGSKHVFQTSPPHQHVMV